MLFQCWSHKHIAGLRDYYMYANRSRIDLWLKGAMAWENKTLFCDNILYDMSQCTNAVKVASLPVQHQTVLSAHIIMRHWIFGFPQDQWVCTGYTFPNTADQPLLEYCGVSTISSDLSWGNNTASMLKKGQQRMYFLTVEKIWHLPNYPKTILSCYHRKRFDFLHHCVVSPTRRNPSWEHLWGPGVHPK